jgi:membrane fusion protein (multidrug efflux system)
MHAMRRTFLRAAAVVIALSAGGAALMAAMDFGDLDAGQTANASDGETEAEPEPVAVEVAPVRVGEIATYIEATSNLVARTRIDVVAEAAGRITHVHADQGDDVTVGAMLVSLDAKASRLALKTARIKAEAASGLHGRGATLADKDLVAVEELQKLTTDRDVARQQLEEAELALSRRRVRAPVKAQVTRRDVTVGQYVREGDTLFELTDFDTLEARIYVPERDALQVTPGREVELVLQARDDVTFPGVVRHVSSKVDPESGTVEITIEVKDAPAQVRSGSFVSVRMVRTRNANATWLPREAVIRGPRGAHVFVVEDSVAHRREVVLGAEEGGKLEIAEGLEASEQVVLSGHGGLDDGESVTAVASE